MLEKGKRGRYDRAFKVEAVELLCCLWLKTGDHVPSIPEAGEQLFGGTGSNQAITVDTVTPGWINSSVSRAGHLRKEIEKE